MRRRLFCAVILVCGFVLMSGCIRSAQTYLKQGDTLEKAGRYAEAQAAYERAVERQPRLALARYKLGVALFKQDKTGEAHDALVRALQLDGSLGEAQLLLADLDLRAFLAEAGRPRALQDRLAEAATQLETRHHRPLEAMLIRSHMALKEGRIEDALALLEHAIRLNPMQPQVTHWIVQALARLGRAEEAEKIATELIGKDPQYGPIYDELYAMYRVSGKKAEAEATFRKKIANNPEVTAYRLQLAAHLVNESRWPEAEGELGALMRDGSRFPTGALDAGDFLVKLGRWEAAVAAYRVAAERGSGDKLAARKRLIQALIGGGKRMEALREAEQTAGTFPRDAEVRMAKASLLLDTREKERAKQAVTELSQIAGDQLNHPLYWYLIGQAQARLGNRDQASAAFQNANRLDEKFKDSRVALAELYLQMGDVKGAMQAVESALAIDPHDLRLKLLRAACLGRSGQAELAYAELSSLARSNPGNDDLQLELGLSQLAQRQWVEAEATFRKLYKPKAADLRALRGLAVSLAGQKQEDKVAALLDGEVALDPQRKELRELYAELATLMKKPALAAKQWEALAKLNPYSADVQFQLGQSLSAAGDLGGAIRALERSRELWAGDPAVVSVLAVVLHRAGRTKEAEAAYRQALKLAPNDGNMQNGLAYLLAETGKNLDEALRLVLTALRSQPSNTAYADTVGWIYVKKKMPDAALHVLWNLVEREPENALYRYHLAMAELIKGNKMHAKATLEAALRKRPSAEEAAQIREALSGL